MFQSLLFPTDFSPLNERLARCLPDLKRIGVEEIVLLNVVELGPQIGFASDTFETMLAWKKDAEPRLKALRDELETSGLRCHWRLELGKPALEIVRVAEEERVSLIVIGTHRHGLLREALLGSVACDVVCRAGLPVLLLAAQDRDSVVQRLFRRVLLTTDFSEFSAEALCMVKEMVCTGLKEVVVLYVRERNRGAAADEAIAASLRHIQEELQFFGFNVSVVTADGAPAKVISRVALEREVSLIVLGAEGRNAGVRELGGVASEVVGRHVCPVLVAGSVGAAVAA